MNPKVILLSAFFLLPAHWLFTQQSPVQLSYINSYKDIAIREMARTGIPASIKLAQAILESNAGQSELALNANNHFGIKCGNNWTGDAYYKKDDDYSPDGVLRPSCFRVYPTVEESFQGHSNFLTDPQKAYRYGALFTLGKTDYQGWAYGLRAAGYATNVAYPSMLIDIIERYNLQQYDLVFPLPEAPAAYLISPPILSTANEVPFAMASGYETAGDIAYRTRMSIDRLLEYNEGLVDGYVLPRGEKVYLAPKRNAFRGPVQYHEVGMGESVYDISQRYGIRVDKLLNRNRLEPGQQPEAGQSLKLRGGKVPAPPVYSVLPDAGFEQNGLPVPTVEQPGEDSPPEAASSTAVYYTVQQDDTLWSIARRYGTTVEQLKWWNNLDNNNIRRGMALRVQ